MFILFTGTQHYPSGGALDPTAAFTSLIDACVARPNCDWAHIAEVTDDGLNIVAIWEPTHGPAAVAGSLKAAGYSITDVPVFDAPTTDPWHRKLCASATR